MSSLAGGEGECKPVPPALQGTLMSPGQLVRTPIHLRPTHYTLFPLSPFLLGSPQYPGRHGHSGLGFCCCCFGNRTSLCVTHWPRTHFKAQAGHSTPYLTYLDLFFQRTSIWARYFSGAGQPYCVASQSCSQGWSWL